VNLERRLGLDFMIVQKEIQVHFVGLLLAAALFTLGIGMFIVTFFRHGLPSDEALGSEASLTGAFQPVPIGK